MATSLGHYEKSFISFVRRNFLTNDDDNHIFAFPLNRNNRFRSNPLLHKLYIHYKLILSISEFTEHALTSHVILIHGYFSLFNCIVLLLIPGLLNKTRWVIWGGDLYNWNFKSNRNLSAFIIERLKKMIIIRLNGIVSAVPGDYLNAKSYFETNAPYFPAFYLPPLDLALMDETSLGSKQTTVRTILLGSRGSITNCHKEVIDYLVSYKGNEEFRVVCPLSYGEDREYITNISNYGRLKLGNIFYSLLEWMDPEEYASILDSVDVAIMNHKRQEGIGNILPLLYAGKKVYLRKSVTTYSWLKKMGVVVFDAEELLEGLDDSHLFYFSPDLKTLNKKLINTYFNEQVCIEQWKRVFSI